MSSFFETVCQTVQREGLLTDTETVVVGFSGGADSVSLLHTLFTHREEWNLSQVIAVHIDHRLRGEESERDRRFAQSFCEERGIPFCLFSYDVSAVAREKRQGTEETGRQLRYQAFEEVASRYPCCRIATAHTADDNAETLLLHLCRGCGLHGLTGIPPMRGNVIRPLLNCARADVEAYCERHNLPFVTDSTNSDTNYSRNRIRHEVMPAFRAINPSAERSMGRLMRQMGEIDRLLTRLTDACWQAITTDRPYEYRKEPLLQTDQTVQQHVFKRMLEKADLPVDEHHIRCMRESLLSGRNTPLPRGYNFTVAKDVCALLPPKNGEDEVAESQPLLIGKMQSFENEIYRVSVISREEYEQKLNICQMLFKNACDYDMITDVAVLRGRYDGDVYHPVGRSCGKSLKKLFNEAAVPIERRKTIPVIADNSGIVLVFGFGCDERVRITEATTRVLLLEKTEE